MILKLFHVRKLGNPSHSLSVYSIISYEQTRLPRDTYIKAHSRNVCIFTNVYFLIILCKNKQIKWSFCEFLKRKICIFVNIWNLEIYSSKNFTFQQKKKLWIIIKIETIDTVQVRIFFNIILRQWTWMNSY